MNDMDFIAYYLDLRYHKQVRIMYTELMLIKTINPKSNLRSFMGMKDSDTIEDMIMRWGSTVTDAEYIVEYLEVVSHTAGCKSGFLRNYDRLWLMQDATTLVESPSSHL